MPPAPPDLAGWAADDFGAAMVTYATTQDLLPDGWPRANTATYADPRGFFETQFSPRVLGQGSALITGYYEPEVEGRAARAPGFEHPLYAMPEGVLGATPWLTRAQIEDSDALAGRELVWLRSAIEVFLAQVQGSVRVRLPSGVLRFGFAGKNGHPYQSIGAALVARGDISQTEISAQSIRDWCADHPGKVADLLRLKPSFVFFKPLDLPADTGPIGAMGRPVSAGRSLAVDPAHQPMGAPIWLDGLNRLVVAQDQGSAIKGAQRGDLFCGTGDVAGQLAGNMQLSGQLVTFFPRGQAQK